MRPAPKLLLMLIVSLSLAASAGACSSQPGDGPQTDSQAPDTPSPEANADLPIILTFGDSLTFGSGVDRELSYPAQLQNELDRLGYAYRVVNSGVSGDTTSGGVARLSMALALEPEIVILELGGNDGLRGIPVEVARDNLRTIIAAFRGIGSRVILAGMTLPLNYGPDYIRDFEAIYVELAEEFDVVHIPFFLEGLIEEYERYMQPDGIHPTGEGYTIVVATVVNTIEPYLIKITIDTK
jgi:acyl-CoA thioesterase-1